MQQSGPFLFFFSPYTLLQCRDIRTQRILQLSRDRQISPRMHSHPRVRLRNNKGKNMRTKRLQMANCRKSHESLEDRERYSLSFSLSIIR